MEAAKCGGRRREGYVENVLLAAHRDDVVVANDVLLGAHQEDVAIANGRKWDGAQVDVKHKSP